MTVPVPDGYPEPMVDPDIPWFAAITTYFGYGLLIFVGHIRDFLDNLFGIGSHRRSGPRDPNLAPLCKSFEDFYTRRLYHRIWDCWNRPVTSSAGAWIDVMERQDNGYQKPLELSDKIRHCLNLGSYNYLGFGDPDSSTRPHVLEALEKFGASTGSYRAAQGTTSVHRELEQLLAEFIGKEDSMVFGMGFGTNSTTIPTLVGPGSLIISDELNHSSLVVGCRTSGASIKVFRHNDVKHLEQIIRSAIIKGQPRTHRPWKKIIIMIEGIYSMEGETCPLADIVQLKKKYKCYLYLDEAHSIGALGATGRGVCEYAGVDPADVDIMMGTFTKSFGSVGGYIAGDKDLIQHIKRHCAGYAYSASISPPACQQVISAINIIRGADGTDLGQRKLKALRENSDYFRAKLLEMGCHVLGSYGSPVVPLMLYNPAKIPAFSRECFKRNLAVVVVGFPATPLLLSRTRFCISAAHTRKDLDLALEKLRDVVETVGVQYAR